MKKTKRFLGIFLATILAAGPAATVLAAAAGESTEGIPPVSGKVMAYLKPDVIVVLHDRVQHFEDANGKPVYPIIYNGSTYLPVRAVSNLMEENIEWDAASKAVFIGKTLSNPNKSSLNQTWKKQEPAEDGKAEATPPAVQLPESGLITVHLKPDVTILFDFEVQKFVDAEGKQVYPIICSGSTYLPIRAVSKLMKEPVEWNSVTRTVTIGVPEVKKENENEDDESETEILLKDSDNAIALKKLFEDEVLLYDQATAKIGELSKAKQPEQKSLLAATISEDYKGAQTRAVSIRKMDTTIFTDEEYEAYKALCDFADNTEYYILVMENIAYMAVEGADYSILAETFFNFAMESSAKLDAARAAIKEIPLIEVEVPKKEK